MLFCTPCNVLSCSLPGARLVGRRCSLGSYSWARLDAAFVSLCIVLLNAWAHPGLPVAVTVTWKQEPLSLSLLNVFNDLLGVYLGKCSYWSTLPLLLLIRNVCSGSLCQNLSVLQDELPSTLWLELSPFLYVFLDQMAFSLPGWSSFHSTSIYSFFFFCLFPSEK